MPKVKEDVYKRIDKFHAHLDVCSQCERHPFALCPTGARLLKDAATEKRECEDCKHWLLICQENPALKATDNCIAWLKK